MGGMNKMKTILKALLILVLVVVLAVGGLLGWLSATEFRPKDVETVEFFAEPEQAAPRLVDGQSLNILSWNIGYAGLGAGSDFFMDGGASAMAASPDDVAKYLSRIAAQIGLGDYDLVMLQEVDSDSKRTYGVDERSYLTIGQSAYALNYSCPFVPIPWPPMGKVNSGLMTSSEYQMSKAERVSLPCPFSWPLRIANLKRCMLVTRLPIEGSDKELVLVNLHLEAYDDGEGKIAQTVQVSWYLQQEYEKGNYVIAAGDFNQSFPGALERYPLINEEYWTPGVLENELLPDGFTYVWDLETPSCRLLNQPYDPSDTAHTQYYIIDGYAVSPNVSVDAIETLDLAFADADHNPVRLRVTLGA